MFYKKVIDALIRFVMCLYTRVKQNFPYAKRWYVWRVHVRREFKSIPSRTAPRY